MADATLKRSVIEWVNNTLELCITRPEDAASGAIACQLLDVLYPNRVPMSKVNWNAKESHEYLPNYKLLITCLSDLRIDKTIDLNKMIHAKPKDILDLLHWFKIKFETFGVDSPGDYDCFMQRAKGKGGNTYEFSLKQKVKTPPSPRAIPVRRPSFNSSQSIDLNTSMQSNGSQPNSDTEQVAASPVKPATVVRSAVSSPGRIAPITPMSALPKPTAFPRRQQVSPEAQNVSPSNILADDEGRTTRKPGIPAPVPRTTAAAAIRMAASRAKTPPVPVIGKPLPAAKPRASTSVTENSTAAPAAKVATATRSVSQRSASGGTTSRQVAVRPATTASISSRGATTARTAPNRAVPTVRRASMTPPATGRPGARRAVSVPQIDIAALQKELAKTKELLEKEKKISEGYIADCDGLMKERDFYFDKLRAIEIFIQEYQESGKGNECSATVLRIMYATQEGFVTSDEDALAAVLSEAAGLIGPDAVAAAASAEEYVKRRASFTGNADILLPETAASAAGARGLN